jgi:hypothetical protein
VTCWSESARTHTHPPPPPYGLRTWHERLKHFLLHSLQHFRTGPFEGARASVCVYIDSAIIHTSIHCSKGQRAELDNPANMTLCELLSDMQKSI